MRTTVVGLTAVVFLFLAWTLAGNAEAHSKHCKNKVFACDYFAPQTSCSAPPCCKKGHWECANKESDGSSPPPPPATPATPPEKPKKLSCQILEPGQGAGGGAADPKVTFECEPLEGGKQLCCFVKHP
jgi:hypothetical protein